MEEYLQQYLQETFQTTLDSCTDAQLYQALLGKISEHTAQLPQPNRGGKKLYYLSAEFLIGKLLSNNLLNLGLYEQTDDLLRRHGRSLAQLEQAEPEPALGNGGLGRLAACFLDSIATLGLNGEG
ncbi:MAG: glycogen/starch/alpha-glucan phosphorylase, partial [Negativibacillus sp.]|nr:glycogen/starch/alpha-glucan phosphorylase [Negativibacillus sp.]